MIGVLLGICGGLIVLALLGLAALALRISSGPLEVELLRERIEQSLRQSAPAAANISIGKTFLVRGDNGPAVRLEDLVLKDSQNRTLIASPSAEVAMNALALFRGKLAMSGLDLAGLDVNMAVLPDGKIAVSAGAGESFELTPPEGAPHSADLFSALFASASAQAPIFGDVQHLKLSQARLRLDDRRANRTATYSDVNIALDRVSSGGLNLALAARGKGGPFTASIQARGAAEAGAERSFDFAANDVPVSEIADNFGLTQTLDASMPVTLKGAVTLAPNGQVTLAQGKLAFGAGHIRIDDPDAEPILIDEITTGFRYDAARRIIDLPALELFSGLSHFNFAGQVQVASRPDAPHTVTLLAKNATLAADAGEKPLPLDQVALEASLNPAAKQVHIGKLIVKGPDIDASAEMSFTATDAGPAVAGSLTAQKTRYKALLRLWPSFIAADLHKWLNSHLTGGMLEKANLHYELDANALAAARARQPIPETSLAIDLAVSGGSLALMPGLPPISAIDGTGHFSGMTGTMKFARAQIDLGQRKVNFSDVSLNLPDFRPKLFGATLSGHTQTTADAAVDLLSREALRRYSNVPGEATQYKGQLEGQVDIDFKIGKAATPDDVAVRTALNATNISVDKVFGAEKLEGATLAINTTKSTLSVKGDGRMFATPVTVELKKNGNAPTDASMSFVLDDAARAKRGIETGPGFSGPVQVKLTAQLADGEHSKPEPAKGQTRAAVEIDLARATIDGLLPGWLKPAGRPGKITAQATFDDETIQLDQFQLDAGNAAFRGSVTLDSDGGFESAKLTSFRLSTQDELKLDVQKDGNLYKLTGSAGTIDARPYISDLLAHSRAKAANGQDFDLDLKATALVGFNKERIEGIDVKLHRRAGVMQRVSLTSRLGGGALKIVSKDSENVGGYVVTADNAGALLSFLDMYRHMEGGHLTLNVHPQSERITAGVQIQNFYLNGEPAMRSLVNANTPSGEGPDHVRFKRLQGIFERTDGRIDISDAVMSGEQVGATLSGMVDYGRDRVDLAGNLIPAYEINNFFAKIPVVGPILGGGKNEGLFALNFRITGKASAPFLRVDPLSAVAPGIFRKILGAADGTANNPDNFVVDAPQPSQQAPSSAPLQLVPPKK